MIVQSAPRLRTSLVCCALLCLPLACAPAAAAQSPTDFSGAWLLDKEKSQGLPFPFEYFQSYARNVAQSERLVVDTELQIDSAKVKAAMQSHATGPAVMFGMLPPSATFNLDGTESLFQGTLTSPAVLSAKWRGDTLELTIKFTNQYQGREQAWTLDEVWELSQGGKVLTVRQTTTAAGVTDAATLVFNKK